MHRLREFVMDLLADDRIAALLGFVAAVCLVLAICLVATAAVITVAGS